jgi:hypothetical protein
LGDPGVLTTTLAFSPPNGMRFATPQATVATVTTIRRSFNVGTTEWSLAARFHIDTFSGANAALSPPSVLGLEVGNALGFWNFVVDPFTDHVHCAGYGLTTNDMIANHGSWHRAFIKITQNGADLKLQCSVDGIDEFPTVAATTVAPPITTHVGIHALAGQGPYSVAYDDVVYDVK